MKYKDFFTMSIFEITPLTLKKSVDDLHEIIGTSSFNDFLDRNKNRNFTQVQYNITMEWNL